MTSRRWVFGLRIALGAALSLSACQHDSNADFDDRNLMSPDLGGASSGGGTSAVAGETSAGGSEADSGEGGGNEGGGGSSSPGGSTSQGGNSSAGVGGSASPTAGKGGKGGSAAGGTTSQAGKGGQGGAGGKGSGGMAGSTNPPEPMMLETTDIDDTYVASCQPLMNFGEAKLVSVDGSTCRYEALIDVPRLELPAGALVSRATLTLTCSNGGGAITVDYVEQAWQELMVRWSSRPDAGTNLGTVTCAEAGAVTLDLTSAFNAWLSGEHPANGIYLRSEASDGTDFVSSEAGKESTRPKLSLTYTVPVE